MKLNIKNQHLFFAMYNAWNAIDYRLKYAINQKVSEDSENDTIQELDINIEDLKIIIDSVNNLPQGVAREINPLMFVSILEQLTAAAQIGNTEAVEMLALIQTVTNRNELIKTNYINQGKLLILE